MTAACVLVNAGRGFVAVPPRRRDILLARLLAPRLDDRLAAGIPPESGRLLAVRALLITRPAARRRLARRWDELAARARQPALAFDPRVPVARAQVLAVSQEIQRIGELLRAPRPLSARGVAIARTMLTRSGSPVYRLGGSAEDLAAAVRRAVEEM